MRELQPVQFVAGEDCEDAVEASELVDEKGEGYQLSGCSQRDDMQEGLPWVSISVTSCTSGLLT